MKPLISIIIPTLNANKTLPLCLESIKNQNYPQDKTEIIISDGGSTDNTLKIANKYHCLIVNNSLKTAEAGKATGLTNSTGQYIALIDSDNILPSPNWLTEMIAPLEKDKTLIGSEPWEFTYRPQAGFIERYCALLGTNDPYAYVIGIYDRRNVITNKWTNIKLDQINLTNYIKVKLQPNQTVPTIGANGTIFRTDFIKKNFSDKYLFDIDLITQVINKTNKHLYFAKIKNDIIHTYCESSISKFIRKQNRRIADYFYYKNIRHYDWDKTNKLGIIKFVLYTILVIPMIFDIIRGLMKKPDIAWFFHPLACWISLFLYSKGTIHYKLGILKQLNRQQWQQ